MTVTAMTEDVVFLIDVDNTLLDNDHLLAELRHYIEREIGAAGSARYWAIFNALRSELGYVDYLGALQRYRVELELANVELSSGATNVDRAIAEPSVDAQQLARIASFLLDYSFAERLYPRAFEVLHHLGQQGQTVILTDGDVVLQPHKIRRSGLWDAVAARVLIYVHKEKKLDAVARHYPARHYVMIDDKPAILAAVKAHWLARVTTVLPLQGHYALDAVSLASYPAPDITISNIGALADLDLSALFTAAKAGA